MPEAAKRVSIFWDAASFAVDFVPPMASQAVPTGIDADRGGETLVTKRTFSCLFKAQIPSISCKHTGYDSTPLRSRGRTAGIDLQVPCRQEAFSGDFRAITDLEFKLGVAGLLDRVEHHTVLLGSLTWISLGGGKID